VEWEPEPAEEAGPPAAARSWQFRGLRREERSLPAAAASHGRPANAASSRIDATPAAAAGFFPPILLLRDAAALAVGIVTWGRVGRHAIVDVGFGILLHHVAPGLLVTLVTLLGNPAAPLKYSAEQFQSPGQARLPGLMTSLTRPHIIGARQSVPPLSHRGEEHLSPRTHLPTAPNSPVNNNLPSLRQQGAREGNVDERGSRVSVSGLLN